MFNYKWCVCDMDGTLLNSKGIISQENINALKRLTEKGVEVIIASGRTDLMMKHYIKQLGLKGHIICCNGSLIKNIGTQEILYSKTIDKNTLVETLSYCFKNNVNFLFYAKNMVFSNKNNPRAKKFEEINKTLSDDLQTPIEYIEESIIKNIDSIEVFKILLISEEQKKIKILENHFSKFDNLEVVSSFNGLLDIMASNISKGNALKILSKKLNVELNKVIAFGDNYNDWDMFQCVGMPIAVKNAVDEIKSAAKYITNSNNESGIAYAIDNFILRPIE
mgnify:CR=1 FL=1